VRRRESVDEEAGRRAVEVWSVEEEQCWVWNGEWEQRGR